jgi:hypothetical protein
MASRLAAIFVIVAGVSGSGKKAERFRPRGMPVPGLHSRVLHDSQHAAILASAESQVTQPRWTISQIAVAVLAELVPSDHYSNIDEASLLKAKADTRTSLEMPLPGTALSELRSADPKWDAALKALGKLRKSYPI